MASLCFHLSNALGQAAIWATCYFAIGWRCQAHPERTARFLAIIHSLLVTGLSVFSLWVGPKPFEYYGESNTYLQELAVSICAGFFTYDLVWTLYHKPNNKAMIAHHALGIISANVVLTRGHSGCGATTAILVLELANPNFYVRWFIHNSKFKDTIVQTLNEVIFLILFFATRVVWLSFLVYTALTQPIPLLFKFLCAAFYILSWVFIVQFKDIILKRYRKRNRDLFVE